MKIYYKVVSEDLESARASVWVTKECFEYTVQYEKDVYVTPKVEGTKLMVFSSVRAAKKFKRIEERLFSCNVINPIKVEFVGAYIPRLKKFWRLYREGEDVYDKELAQIAPNGTVFCDAVKLLEEII